MHVPELLDPFALGPNVEIVIARLPEGALAALDGNRKLERQNCACEERHLRFTQQHVDMFRHDYVSGNEEAAPPPHRFEGAFKSLSRLPLCQDAAGGRGN
jgi:hypothetical protein